MPDATTITLADSRTRRTLHRCGSLATAARRAAWARTPDADELKQRAIAARDQVLADLPGHLARLEATARAHGVVVQRAQSAQEANRHIIHTMRELGVTDALRNHHPLLYEIQVDRAAKANGIQLTPLHPGDHLTQLADETPGHPIWPAGHLTVEAISGALQEKWRVPETYNPDHLASTVRMPLRRTLLRTHTAILGVDFAAVQEGVFTLMDNDGHNASLAGLARHIILLLSIEQIAATLDDLDALVQVFALSAWGRVLPAYVTQLQRPAPPEIDGPRTLHLILVDNRRTEIIEQGFGQALRCIQCGACHTACPVYQQIGGAGYAHSPYTGPIGAVINPILMRPDLGEPQAYLCASSGHCQRACPVGIPIPELIHRQRSHLAQARPQRNDKRHFTLWRRLLARPALFHPHIRHKRQR
jgi:L-lactate dehydrogenase complex protein LldF